MALVVRWTGHHASFERRCEGSIQKPVRGWRKKLAGADGEHSAGWTDLSGPEIGLGVMGPLRGS